MESKIKLDFNKNAKVTAQDILPEKLKEIEPGADRTACVKKINSLRSSFRRELKNLGGLNTY